jgi:D-proline reductase (dithiol) PrdB
MVRLADLPEGSREHLAKLPCRSYDTAPWVTGPPLGRRRVAIISTAGLQVRGDRPFGLGADDYRVIPGDTPGGDLIMSHVSTNFDRSGFQQDLNVAFPIDRLREMAADGEIGSVADFQYSFMGATDPDLYEGPARRLAELLKKDNVDAALLVPI